MSEQIEKAKTALHDAVWKMSDSRSYVRLWIETNDYYIKGNGDIKKKGEAKPTPSKDIFDSMWLDYKQDLTRHRIVNEAKPPKERVKVFELNEQDTRKALYETIRITIKEERARLSKLITYNGSDLQNLRTAMTAVDGLQDETNVAVMAHWMWCIKRKNLDLPVLNHLMPVFYGAQGAGKTTFIMKLCEPLEDFLLQIPLTELGEERYNMSLANNLICLFDEMKDAERTDVNKLKLQITTLFNSTRIYHSQEVTRTSQSCMFIGASNKPLNELVFDTTGMRRFYQINSLAKLDWPAIESIDALAIWQSIDEHKIGGYYEEHAPEIKRRQRDLVQQDEIESFIEDMCINVGSEQQLRRFAYSDVYSSYVKWAEKGKGKVQNTGWFSRKFLNRLNCKKDCIKENNKLVTYYMLNKDCGITEDLVSAGKVMMIAKGKDE